LRRMFVQKNISHVHATSSRALICGVLLKKLLGITLSASIEAKPPLSRQVIENALRHTVGGRIADRRLHEQMGDSFILDRASSRRLWARGRARFWQEWIDLLDRWSSEA